MVAATLASPAWATNPTAEALFHEGVRLMEQGNFAEACPKLEGSQELEPRSGTLISLAFCHQHLGRSATAWGEYRAAISLARKEERPDYAAKAIALADELEPRLSRLRVTLESAGQRRVIVLDGTPMPEGQLDVAVPVDPGLHQLEVRADGFQSWTREVTVPDAAGTTNVTVPALRLAAPPPAVPTAPAPVPIAPAPVPSQAGASSSSAWGWGLGAVGVTSTAVGIGLGAVVLQRQSTLEEECDIDARRCSAAGLEAADGAPAMAIAANVLLASGLAVTGVAIYLLAADGEADHTARVTLRPAEASLRIPF